MRSEVRYTPETEWKVSPVYEYIVSATAHWTHNTPRMMQSVSMRTMMVSLPWNYNVRAIVFTVVRMSR